jgi:competence protein ComEC
LIDKDIVVKRLCFNSDASKDTQVWDQFKVAIRNARRNKGLIAEPQLTTTQTGRLDSGEVHIQVLYPYPELASSGPGSRTPEGTPLTSNSMSAVLRLRSAQGAMVLLAGDVERGCLNAWREEGADPSANVLVFPHHGGNPGRDDPADFAVEMTKAVKPKAVIFSIHRSQYDLPLPDVVDAVRRSAPGVRIVCTQLSARCTTELPDTPFGHLTEHMAHGKGTKSCCAGTIIVDLSGSEAVIHPTEDEHLVFIGSLRGSPLCTRGI